MLGALIGRSGPAVEEDWAEVVPTRAARWGTAHRCTVVMDRAIANAIGRPGGCVPPRAALREGGAGGAGAWGVGWSRGHASQGRNVSECGQTCRRMARRASRLSRSP